MNSIEGEARRDGRAKRGRMGPGSAHEPSTSAVWHLEHSVEGGHRVRRIPIQTLPFRVGRLPGLELILAPPLVSRSHAEFFDREGVLWLRDLGSKSGTFLNRRRVREAALEEGDVIHFADIEFRLADSNIRILEPDLRGFTITGPFSHKNLSAYLISGGVPSEGLTFCTLQQALRRGRAVVHETGDVDCLVAENLADEESVFVQSGDIVKGGRQDRTIRFDTLVPPRSKVEMQAYCVEHGRWHRRGGEDDGTFSGSDTTAPTTHMKTTIIRGLAQADVWGSIGDTQERLTDTIGGGVRSSVSPSSYQLTAESVKVKEAVAGYLEALGRLADAEGAVGAVIAINGAFNRADLYVTEPLFKELWPKLLEGAAVEAVSRQQEYEQAAVDEAPGLEEVAAYLKAAREGEGSEQEASPHVLTTTIVTGKTTFYETRVLKPRDTWIHHGYISEAVS